LHELTPSFTIRATAFQKNSVFRISTSDSKILVSASHQSNTVVTASQIDCLALPVRPQLHRDAQNVVRFSASQAVENWMRN